MILFSKAQNFKDNLIIETNTGYGFLFAHHSFLNYFNEHHPYLFNMRISKSVSGNKGWHKTYRYPKIGYGVHFCDFGNKEYLGNTKSVYSFINIPITRNEFCNWNYSIGAGFSWLNKYFDIESNHYNIAIGSPGNVYFNLASDLSFRLSNKVQLYTELSFTHYSNGSFAKPNTGINIVTYNLGIQHNINPVEKIISETESFKKENELSIIFGAGMHEKDPPIGKKYFISTLTFNLKRQFWQKRNLGLAFDIMYDESLKERLKNDSTTFSGNIPNYKLGILFTHDFIIGNTSIIMQTGRYILQEYKKDGVIYSRFGLNQKINEHLLINITLKTHFFKADYVEWGLGYIIH